MPRRSRHRERVKKQEKSIMEQEALQVARIGKITCKVCKKTFNNIEEYKDSKHSCDLTSACPKRENKPSVEKRKETRTAINPTGKVAKGAYYYDQVDSVIQILVKR